MSVPPPTRQSFSITRTNGKQKRPQILIIPTQNDIIADSLCVPCVSASRCVDRACSPPIGNLASGRALRTLSGCHGNRSSRSLRLYPPAHPHLCIEDTHPSSHMADDPFLHPDTWWASSAATGAPDEIRLDLETRFFLSHVILVFRSPRPAAMAIERSADFGKTWETLRLFAQNCSAEFGLPDNEGSLCTSRYTAATPCTKGEVRKCMLDPNSHCFRVVALCFFSPLHR